MTNTYAGKLSLAKPWAPMERQHQLGNSVCVYHIDRWWGVLADVSGGSLLSAVSGCSHPEEEVVDTVLLSTVSQRKALLLLWVLSFDVLNMAMLLLQMLTYPGVYSLPKQDRYLLKVSFPHHPPLS